MPRSEFNPALAKWLNARNYVSGDWPDNISKEIQREADLEIGKGYLLNTNGWPTYMLITDGKYLPR